MAWKRLTINDLRLVLSEDEVEKLNTRSLDSDIEQVIQQQLDVVADAFRGAWSAKGYTVDVRDHYIAPEYANFVLNYARWQIWTRFPSTEDYSLTEPRKAGYEEAVELLKDPYIGISKPDYSDDPELSSTQLSSADAAIAMPWLRFLPLPYKCGFPQAYFSGNCSF